MTRRRRLTLATTATSLLFLVPSLLSSTAAEAAPSGTPVVLHSAQVTRQDVESQAGSEPDTVVEPDAAVNPTNSSNAIAAAHDSRFPDGGAVAISVAYTINGGRSWHHRPVPGITTATGGSYDRGSDPVVTFDASGTAYLSVLLIDVNDCNTGVAVLTSSDGGQTWSAPHYAHQSTTCTVSDDKNWIVTDTNPSSPHFGRVYQFWTPFFYTEQGRYTGAPQAVRWSDDQARTWSDTHYVNGKNHGSQNSQPMILKDGTIVDTFYDYGKGGAVPDVPGLRPEHVPAGFAAPTTIDASGTIYATRSSDGGATWSDEVEVANNAGGYSPGVRCCLFAADLDVATQTMYTAYLGGVGDADPVYVSWSKGGQQWTSPQRVSQGDVAGVTRVNVDVVADKGTVYVTYGTRTHANDHGGYVQQQLSSSTDGGLNFAAPMSIGPRSALQYAAQAGGLFPGDYIGAALSNGRLYVTFARSSTPPLHSDSPYHQVIWGVTLRTT
jgi:hypothetical protein